MDSEISVDNDGRTFFPMSKIWVDHDFNCRGHIAPIDVAELAKDIEENGLIQPVCIQEINDTERENHPEDTEGKRWKLISGFRRTIAHRVIGKDKIFAVIQNHMDEIEARFFNLRENLQRKELTFDQEAAAIAPMVKARLNRKEMCKKLGMKDGWVQLRAMYLKLPELCQKEVKAGIIPQTGIREIYTAFHRNGETAAIQVTRELKDAKIKGLKTQPRSLKKLQGSRDRKKLRKKPEIMSLNERLLDMVGSNLTTRALAWASGEISDSELEESIKEYAGEKYTAEA